MRENLLTIKNMLDGLEAGRLAPHAALSRRAERRRPDGTADTDHRQGFAIDVDRILHSLAYTRYIDKTQVFYLIRNDHITHRVLHVQLVSRIARTVGRYLGLNEDLIEAVSLGHDIGHAPFGHDGEAYLSKLCLEAGIGHFVHAVQSVEFLDRIERDGRGLNLTIEVLDGILCHDGELDLSNLKPAPRRDFADLDRHLKEKKQDPHAPLFPMTVEGCVVRLADTISYVGRDMEDAIRLGLIRREDLPPLATRVLGDTNGKIVYSLVTDLISNSSDTETVAFSPEVAEALIALKNFNRDRIYYNPAIKSDGDKIRNLYEFLFTRLEEDLKQGRESVPLFAEFARRTRPRDDRELKPAAVVRDFLAGMTDEYFLRLGRELLLPHYRYDIVDEAGI